MAVVDYQFYTKGPDLSLLQANILHPNALPFQWFLFFSLNDSVERGRLKAGLSNWAVNSSIGVSTAQDQLNAGDYPPPVVTNAFLGHSGLEKVVPNTLDKWGDVNFRYGMKDAFVRAKLGDPPLDKWTTNYQQPIDLLISIAAPSVLHLEERLGQLLEVFQKDEIGNLLFIEKGAQLYRDGHEIEPFGFRDNLSQPVLWDKDGQLKNENLPLLFDAYWGSYLVFRKLEQDVGLFEKEVGRLSSHLGISKPLAEAQIMGRFKDGTPLALFDQPVMQHGTPEEKELVERFNNFERDDDHALAYQDDPLGYKCPFHAHVRKANPRVLEKLDDPRYIDYKFRGQIIRRSIPYEQGQKRGLLFLCYQRSIRFQFEMIQKFWCNNPEFPKNAGAKGIDPVAGQSAYENCWNQGWGDKSVPQKPLNLARFVYFRGGAFFYAPSIAFFHQLGLTQIT